MQLPYVCRHVALQPVHVIGDETSVTALLTVLFALPGHPFGKLGRNGSAAGLSFHCAGAHTPIFL